MKNYFDKMSELFQINNKNAYVELSENDIIKAKEYLNWLKYEPKHWNIGGLLKKSNNELTINEKEKLKLRNLELKLIPIFESYINNRCIKYLNIICNVINNINISDFINFKLTKTDIEEYDESIFSMLYEKDTDISPKEKIKNFIQNIDETDSIKNSYIKYMLNIRLHNLENTQDINTNKHLGLKKIIKVAEDQINK